MPTTTTLLQPSLQKFLTGLSQFNKVTLLKHSTN